jgi:CHASE2 domain-containing sensor protein
MKAARTLYASENRPSAHLPLILLQVPTVALAIYGFVLLWKRETGRRLALAAFVYIGYFYGVVAAGMPMLRYFAPVLPLVLAMAAVGMSSFAKVRLHSPNATLHTAKANS